MIDVRHITTGSPDQIGGIASIIRDSAGTGGQDGPLSVKAHFIEPGVLTQDWARPLDKAWRRVRDKLNRLCAKDPSLHPYRYPGLTIDRFAPSLVAGADILHVHKPTLWAQAISLSQRPGGPALIFHAHSVDGFTGGCVLEQDCPELSNQCNDCPIIHPGAGFLPHRGWSVRHEQIRRGRPYVIANSQATLDAIERSALLSDAVERSIVYPAVNPQVFFTELPEPSGTSSKEPTVRIGFISYSVENPNKGFADFVGVLRHVENDRTVAGIVAGHVQAGTRASHPGLSFTGPLQSESELRQFYSALDVLVVPSVSESFGKVSVEAQFCGTPVVCYNRGGLPETVLDGVTGRVTTANTHSSLRNAVRAVLGWSDIRHRFESSEAHQFLKQFRTQSIANDYRSIYRRRYQASK